MKGNIIKSLFWAIVVMIGLIITNILKDESINITKCILGAIIIGVLDFSINTFLCKNKK